MKGFNVASRCQQVCANIHCLSLYISLRIKKKIISLLLSNLINLTSEKAEHKKMIITFSALANNMLLATNNIIIYIKMNVCTNG